MNDDSIGTNDSEPVLSHGPAQPLKAQSEDVSTHAQATRESAVMIAAQILKHHSGPLPDPDTLAAYERILPGAAERILRQFERQSDHRMELETRTVRSDALSQVWSTISASLLALSAVIGGILLAWTGHYASGLSMFFGTLFTFLGTFVAGKRAQARAFDAKPTKQQLLQAPVAADRPETGGGR